MFAPLIPSLSSMLKSFQHTGETPLFTVLTLNLDSEEQTFRTQNVFWEENIKYFTI